MMKDLGPNPGGLSSVQQLRANFDRIFAESAAQGAVAVEAFLAIRVAGAGYALRLSEISALVSHKAITRLPSSTPHLLGIAGFRGNLLPAYDLAGLLGYSGAASPLLGIPGRPSSTTSFPLENRSRAIWLVLSAPARVALVFEHFEGQLRVPVEAVIADQGRLHIGAVLAGTEHRDRPVLRLSSLIEAIVERADAQNAGGDR